MSELFPQDAAEGLLQRFTASLNMLSECEVNEALIVSPSSCMNLIPEPLKYIVIKTDGDSRLTRRNGYHLPSLPLAEIVSLCHMHHPSYWRRSLDVALRAETTLIFSPRHV